jgi:peptidyl-prolyl cis-trans isomerase D
VLVLEQMVKKFRGVVLGLIVGALSLVFVLQFGGPQAQGCSGTQGARAAAEVYGQNISRNDLESAYILNGGENYPDELAKQHKLREMVLHGLVERELLAREARRLGFDVSEEEVLQKIAEDGLIYRSMSVNAGPYLPPSGPQRFSFENSKGEFDKTNLRNFIQYRLRRSIQEFTRDQAQENLAQRMRETIFASVVISPDELWDAYVREKENVKLKYVRLSSIYYAQQQKPTEQEIAAFIAEHAKDIDAAYERDKQRYTGLEKQVRARHILVKLETGANDEAKAKARAKADALLVRTRKGEDFARLATQSSDDAVTAKKGGDLGFNPKGRMVKPFDEAQFAMKPGQISDVVESPFGYHIIKVEAVREGDVPLDEAKRELGEKLYRDSRAAVLAKQAADELLAKVQAGVSLEDAVAALETGRTKATGKEGKTGGKDASKEVSKETADPLAPEVRETRPFGRTDSAIAGPFDSTPLVKAAYELTADKPLPQAPMQLGDDWFVYRLDSRTDAQRADFTAKEQARLQHALLRRKQTEVLELYIRGLRDKALADDDIAVDTAVLEEATTLPN